MQKCPSCPKCQSFYSTKDGRGYHKHPLLLDCGHTFCQGCLQALAKEGKTAILCPVCQVSSTVEGDVKSLWPDLYTVGLVVYNQRTLLDRELSKITLSQMMPTTRRREADLGDKHCRECMRKLATCRCEKCDFIMCMQCFDKIHSTSNMLKQHLPVPLSSENSQLEVSPMCKQHDGRPIEYYCEDDCLPICSRCVIMGDHKKHSITSMEEKNKAIFADMEPALHTGTKVLRKLRKAEQMVGTLVPDMKMETTTVIDEIHSHFQVLHGMLQAREKQLVDDVFNVYRTGIQPLSILKEQMYEDMRKLEISIKAAQRILNNNNEVILNANDILSQLQAAKDLPCIIHEKKEKREANIRFEPGLSLPTAIAGYGGIDGTVPIMAEWHTISEMPEELMLDDCDTPESTTPADSIISASDTATSDIIVEDDDEGSVVSNKHTVKATKVASHKGKKSKPVLVPIPPKSRIKGGQDRVYVTHIRNPCHFMVQRCGDATALRKLSRQINTACKKASMDKEIPTGVEKGDLLLGRYSNDNQWYRVQVKHVLPGDNKNQMKLDILYLDYGNSEVISIDRVRKMQQKFMEYPPFLIECCLSDIVPVDKDGSWSLEAIQTFAKMTDGKPLILFVISEVNNVLHVDLSKPPDEDIQDDRPISVRDTLVFLELANFITPASSNVVGMPAPVRRYMQPTPVATESRFDAHLTCANDPSDFYVQQIGEESAYFNTLMQQMQEQYNMDSGDLWIVYCPRIDMICVARFQADDTWYRAQVKALPGNKMVTVQYVDYGNTETVDITRLRKVLDTFLVLPIQAYHCQLCDVGSTIYTHQAKRWWGDRVTMKQFSLTVKGVEDEQLSVVMYDDNSGGFSINSELVSRGFAPSTGSLSSQVPKGGLGGLVTSSEDSSAESQSEQPSSLPIVSSGTTSSRSSSRSSSRTASRSTTPVVSPKKPMTTASPLSESGVNSDVASSSESSEKASTKPKVIKSKISGLSLDVEAASAKAKSPVKETTEPESPATVQVIISYFQSPSHFYVQLSSAGEDGLHQMMTSLQEEYGDSDTQWVSWKVASFCAAKYLEDGRWYRAKIISILHKNVMEVSDLFAEVMMVDFGYTCTVSQTQIRPLAGAFLKQMCFAFHCHLANVVPAGDGQKWSRTACEFMEDTVQGTNMYIQKLGDMENESLPIDLLLEEHIAESALEPTTHRFYSLIGKVVEQGLGLPTKRRTAKTVLPEVLEPTLLMESGEDPSPCVFYLPPQLPTGDSIKGMPSYVDYDGTIYIQDASNRSALKSIAKRLEKKFGHTKPPSASVNWKLGQACAARFPLDECWYRSKVSGVGADHIQVKFVDFGNSEYMTSDQLRAGVQDFIDVPQLCVECVLNNISPMSQDGRWPVPVLDQMHKTIVTKPCVAEIVKVEGALQLSIDLSVEGIDDLGNLMCRRRQAFRPDNTQDLVNQSCKIAQIVENSNPYKSAERMPPGEYFSVVITHVEVPNVVYFQHTRQSGSEMDERMDEINSQLSKLEQLAFDLNELGPVAAALPNPRPGLMCCAQFGFDQCWYRAVVVERDDLSDMILVLYVDYGTSEYVTVDRVRALPSRFGSLAAQAVRLTLSDVTPTGRGQWTKQSLEAIMTSVCNKELIACLRKCDRPTGDLYVVGSSAGAALTLAYQEVGDKGLVTLPDEAPMYEEEDQEVEKVQQDCVETEVTNGQTTVKVTNGQTKVMDIVELDLTEDIPEIDFTEEVVEVDLTKDDGGEVVHVKEEVSCESNIDQNKCIVQSEDNVTVTTSDDEDDVIIEEEEETCDKGD